MVVIEAPVVVVARVCVEPAVLVVVLMLVVWSVYVVIAVVYDAYHHWRACAGRVADNGGLCQNSFVAVVACVFFACADAHALVVALSWRFSS